jgi:hypothetical protein
MNKIYCYTIVTALLLGANLLSAQQVDILVESELKSKIQTKLDQYVSDLTNEGFSPNVITVSQSDDPSTIRNTLKTHYTSNDLEGVVVIGRVPFVFYKWADSNVYVDWYVDRGQVPGTGWGHYDVFPTYYYYSNLTGSWGSKDSYGNYTSISGNKTPDVWLGVIRADGLTATGKSESSLVNSYLDRAHKYRTGTLSGAPPARALGVLTGDDPYFYDLEGYWRDKGAILMDDTTIMADYPCKSTYLDTMDSSTGYRVHWHKSGMFWSSSNGFCINLPACGQIVKATDVLSRNPKICFYAFIGACTSGNFDIENYWSGIHVFGTSYGLASLQSYSNDNGSLWERKVYNRYFGYVRAGWRIGEAYLTSFQEMGEGNDIGGHIIGDPTLRVNSHQGLGKEIAKGKSVSGSGSVSRITDGSIKDGNTWTSSDASAQSVTINLGSSKTVGGALVAWDDGSVGRDYSVQTSDSSSGPWTTRKSVSGSSTIAKLLVFGSPVSCQYVRLYMTSGNGSRFGIREMMVFEGESNIPQTVPAAPTGLRIK